MNLVTYARALGTDPPPRVLETDPPTPVLAAVPTAEASDHDLVRTRQTLRRATGTADVRPHAALLAVQLPAQSVEAPSWLARVPRRRLTLSRLAVSLGVTSGGLTTLVDRLVQDGLGDLLDVRDGFAGETPAPQR